MENTNLESRADAACAAVEETKNALIARIEELERENEMLKKEIASKMSLN